MAILHSCCFWKTVRRGSYASAIYTLVYFGCSSFVLLQYLKEEHEYLTGKTKKPTGESVLERGEVSPTSVIFNILFLVCSMCLVVSSALVVVGLWKNKRYLLLPWTFFMLADIFIEFSHLVYLVKLHRLVFDPLVSVVLTTDFFIMCLNVYCLLCVISQYQEYKEALLNRDLTDANGYNVTNGSFGSSTCPRAVPQSRAKVGQKFSTILEESQTRRTFSEDENPHIVDKAIDTCALLHRPMYFIRRPSPENIFESTLTN